MLRPVKVIIAGVDQFSPVTDKLGKKLVSMGDRMGAIGGVLSTRLTLPLVAFATVSAKTGMDFEAAMNRISMNSDLAGSRLAAFKEKLLDMSTAVGSTFRPVEIGQASADLLQAGLKQEEVLNAMPAAMKAAQVGQSNLQETALALTTTMAQFALPATEANRILNSYTVAANETRASISSLSEGMKIAGHVGKSFGLTMEETLGIVASLQQGGVSAAESGTSFKMLELGLANVTGVGVDIERQLEAEGVRFRDKAGNALNPLKVVGDIAKVMESKGMGSAAQGKLWSALFGSYGSVGVMALVNSIDKDGKFLGAKLTQSMKDRQDALARGQDIMSSGSKVKMFNMMASWDRMLIKFYDSALAERLAKMFDSLGRLFDKIVNMPKWMLDFAFTMGVIAAAAGPLIGAGGVFMKLAGNVMVLLSALKGTALFIKVGLIGSTGVFALLAYAIYKVTDAISGYLLKRDEFDEAGNARTGQLWVKELARMWNAAGNEVSRFLGLQWEAQSGDETDTSMMTDKQRRAHMANVRMKGEIAAAKESAAIQEFFHLATPVGFMQDLFAPIDFSDKALKDVNTAPPRPMMEQMMDSYLASASARQERFGEASRGDFRLVIEGAPKGSKISPVNESGPSKLFPMFDMGTRLGL